MQDAQGSVTAVDVKTMKAIAHYPLGDKGRCNGLALDAKNHVLFAACANSGNPPAQPAQPMMVILSAKDGKIFTSLPLVLPQGYRSCLYKRVSYPTPTPTAAILRWSSRKRIRETSQEML
jgi:hypothetical protein